MSEILHVFQQHARDRLTSLHFTMNFKIQQFTAKAKTVYPHNPASFQSLACPPLNKH